MCSTVPRQCQSTPGAQGGAASAGTGAVPRWLELSQWFMVFWTSTNPILCLRFRCSVICNSNKDTLRQFQALLLLDVLPKCLSCFEPLPANSELMRHYPNPHVPNSSKKEPQEPCACIVVLPPTPCPQWLFWEGFPFSHTCSFSSFSWEVRWDTSFMVVLSLSCRLRISFCSPSPSLLTRDMARIRGNQSRFLFWERGQDKGNWGEGSERRRKDGV